MSGAASLSGFGMGRGGGGGRECPTLIAADREGWGFEVRVC